MAVYKVPQDVEAEDKLIGPLSFRQFIYLMVAGGSAFVAFLLYQLSPFLVIIPLPLILAFGILALPLRKDQPMEVYLLAVIRFWIKPHRRIWNPDGTINYVEITVPIVEQQPFIANRNPETTEERLDYLARIMDSRGWSMKRMDSAQAALTPGVVDEAANATDIMDDHADLAKSFDDLLAKKNQQQRAAALQTMQQARLPRTPQSPVVPGRDATQAPAVPYTPPAVETGPALLRKQFSARPDVAEPQDAPRFNPYPTIHQKVINPYEATAETPDKKTQPKPATAMTAPVSPAIMNLASNNNLSISAIAREAHRLQEGDEGEVVITLH